MSLMPDSPQNQPPMPCRSLQCPGCKVKAQGHLADEEAELSTLTALNMQSNQLNGTLPAAYGAAGVLPRLLNLVLSSNQLSGASVHMMPGGGWRPGLVGAGWCMHECARHIWT